MVERLVDKAVRMPEEPPDYPRVLILSRTEVSERSSQGAALGNWFRDWPKDRLAHIYSRRDGVSAPFCPYSYLLTGHERRWGRLFERLKSEAQTPSDGAAAAADQRSADRPGRLAAAMKRWGKLALLDTGLWELLFTPKLSPPLVDWIRAFRPEVVFANVSDLGYMWLAEMLHKRFRLPLCLDIVDDWASTLYRDSILGFAMSPLVDRTLRRLLAQSSICLTIGKEMEREYRRRYHTPAEALMCCDETDRFSAAPRRIAPPDEIAVVYCGSLGNNRWMSMVDLFEAVEALRAEGKKIGVYLYSSQVPLEAGPVFAKHPWVGFAPIPPHDEVAAILKGADVLFHAESFDGKYQDYIRLSVSAKSQIYMLSGVPVLVYAPAGVGVVEYARNSGWACVVDRPDRKALQEAILRLATDAAWREPFVARARQTFAENHDARVVRERLRQILLRAASQRQ